MFVLLIGALVGCYSERLEAPYVLSTGLGEAKSISPSVRATLLAASSTGIWELNQEGTANRLWDQPTLAVTSSPNTLFALSGGQALGGEYPAPGQTWKPTLQIDATGATDLLAWCEGLVLIADKGGITAWDMLSGETSLWSAEPKGVTALALSADCGAVLAVTPDAVWSVNATGATAVCSGLISARAAAVDRQGQLWVVAGDPPVLNQVKGGKAEVFARFLGDPRDLHFGTVDPWPTQNLYLADGEGTVDYVRTP